MLKVTRITPILPVDDIEKTIDYYRETLGFKVQMIWESPETMEATVAVVQSNNFQIMFQKGKTRRQTDIKHSDLYIQLEGLRDLAIQIRGKVGIISDLTTNPQGAEELVIRDCNGYVITFAEVKGVDW